MIGGQTDMSRFLDVSKAATLHRYAYGVGQRNDANAFSSTVLLRNALDNYDDY